MLKIEHLVTMNWDNAFRGARNPMGSWARADSALDQWGRYILGPNDLNLAVGLCRAGPDHRKFTRQLHISADVTGPLYWWKEFDTYKVGTVANSTSTMHKLHARPLTLDEFSTDHMTGESRERFGEYVAYLETVRLRYLETQDKADWYDLIQLLPDSYNQKRTVTLNYEVAQNIYFARRDHKLQEWHVMCDAILTLPYFKEFFVS